MRGGFNPSHLSNGTTMSSQSKKLKFPPIVDAYDSSASLEASPNYERVSTVNRSKRTAEAVKRTQAVKSKQQRAPLRSDMAEWLDSLKYERSMYSSLSNRIHDDTGGMEGEYHAKYGSLVQKMKTDLDDLKLGELEMRNKILHSRNKQKVMAIGTPGYSSHVDRGVSPQKHPARSSQSSPVKCATSLGSNSYMSDLPGDAAHTVVQSRNGIFYGWKSSVRSVPLSMVPKNDRIVDRVDVIYEEESAEVSQILFGGNSPVIVAPKGIGFSPDGRGSRWGSETQFDGSHMLHMTTPSSKQ